VGVKSIIIIAIAVISCRVLVKSNKNDKTRYPAPRCLLAYICQYTSCKPYVENLAEQFRSQNIPEDTPESLQAACGELQRLLLLL